jgi:hypothetical protein
MYPTFDLVPVPTYTYCHNRFYMLLLLFQTSLNKANCWCSYENVRVQGGWDLVSYLIIMVYSVHTHPPTPLRASQGHALAVSHFLRGSMTHRARWVNYIHFCYPESLFLSIWIKCLGAGGKLPASATWGSSLSKKSGGHGKGEEHSTAALLATVLHGIKEYSITVLHCVPVNVLRHTVQIIAARWNTFWSIDLIQYLISLLDHNDTEAGQSMSSHIQTI